MFIIKGKSVYGAIAIGTVEYHGKKNKPIIRYRADDVTLELERFRKARQRAIEELEELYLKASDNVGEKNAAVFDIHRMMLEDEDYGDSVENIIKSEEVNAEYAVGVTCENFAGMFSTMEDSYMQERSQDVKDVSERILEILSGAEHKNFSEDAKIIAAEDLLPSETVNMDKSKVLAFVTEKGSVNSHTAILARTMGIPALVSIGRNLSELDGKCVIVDGFNGVIYVEPDAETLSQMQEKKNADDENKRLLQELKGKKSETIDGKSVLVYANIGGVGDVADVLQNDADGIGLFRSEFIYMNKKELPDENEQLMIYKNVVQNMAGKKVVIRTLDIGADKQAECFGLEHEENPALGYRAVRICLERPDIFKTQLRAILRASAFGSVAIMVPMIVSLKEVLSVKDIFNKVKEELLKSNVPFDSETELGIMIETPAAALISDTLASEVDFFSIGTNDLTQYTLAADRQNSKVDSICTPYHRSVLELIAMTIKNAHEKGIWVGICGEAAGDLELCQYFVGLGVDELSVSPSKVLSLRDKIRKSDSNNKSLPNVFFC